MNEQTPAEIMEPGKCGVFNDLDAEIYHALPGWGSTLTKTFMTKSPAHAKVERDGTGKEPSAATIRSRLIGKAEHTIILEPHRYGAEFCILPNDIASLNKNSKAYKEGLEAFIHQEAAGRSILTLEEEEKLLSMRDSVWSHPKAEALLTGRKRKREASAWTHVPVGDDFLLCKARPDLWLPGLPVDLKTTIDANPKTFGRALLNFGYHVQAAHYLDVLKPYDEGIGDLFGIIAVEKEPPYAVSVFRINGDAISLARHQLMNVRPRIVACEKADRWPGYSDEIETIDLPPYAYTQAEFEESSND